MLTAPKVVQRVHAFKPPLASLGRTRKIGLLGSHHSLEFAPWDDSSWELWGHASSRHFYQREPERYFDLHRRECWEMAHKQDRYMNWLRKNIVPIYMQEVSKDVPASIRYPKEILFAEYRGYFTCHAAYMIALALSEGVTHIGLWGINYSGDSEYGTQRGSCEYWLGFAEGKGVQIILPYRCNLLNHPTQLYGYESHDEKGRLIEPYRPKKATIGDGLKKRELRIFQPGEKHPPLPAPPPHITQEMLEQERRNRPSYAKYPED